jgi:hypothetical protein
MSKSQEKLEQASKAVGAACRALVRQVQSLIKERSQEEDQVDYSKLGAHEFKVREMEQQVSSETVSCHLFANPFAPMSHPTPHSYLRFPCPPLHRPFPVLCGHNGYYIRQSSD